MSDTADSCADIERRIGLAAGVARSLATVWKSKDIGIPTKVRLYNALVLSVLLYNAETWTMKEDLNQKLLVFEMSVLRCIAGVTRKHRRRNEDIRRELGITRDVVNHVRARRLTYFGHVVRMQPTRIPNVMLYGRVQGKRPMGRPKKKVVGQHKRRLSPPWLESGGCRPPGTGSSTVEECCSLAAGACGFVCVAEALSQVSQVKHTREERSSPFATAYRKLNGRECMPWYECSVFSAYFTNLRVYQWLAVSMA